MKVLKDTLKTLVVVSLALPSGNATTVAATALPLQEVASERSARFDHAQELLGARYTRAFRTRAKEAPELYDFIYTETQRSLPKAWKKESVRISRAIIAESRKNHWDPNFLMAIIKTESAFNPAARGRHGEIGLMQLLPNTALWLSQKAGLGNKQPDLHNPVVNIKLGSAYLAFLRRRLSADSGLYIAAYNMGLTNVKRALGRHVRPTAYATKVLRNYIVLYSKLTAARMTPAPLLADAN